MGFNSGFKGLINPQFIPLSRLTHRPKLWIVIHHMYRLSL